MSLLPLLLLDVFFSFLFSKELLKSFRRIKLYFRVNFYSLHHFMLFEIAFLRLQSGSMNLRQHNVVETLSEVFSPSCSFIQLYKVFCQLIAKRQQLKKTHHSLYNLEIIFYIKRLHPKVLEYY